MLKKYIGQNFKFFFRNFHNFHDFPMSIMGIKTTNAQSIFRKKVSMGLILHTMSSKMFLGYTDTVPLCRRYTIGVQSFSIDLLWH